MFLQRLVMAEVFRYFPQFFETNTRIMLLLCLLPSKSVPIRQTTIIITPLYSFRYWQHLQIGHEFTSTQRITSTNEIHLTFSKLFHPHFLQYVPLKKRQNNLITGLDRPWGLQEVDAPRFQDSRHMKMVSLSALRTGHVYPPGNIPVSHFCKRLSRPQGHSAAGRIMSIKNSNDTIGNRTRDLPAFSAVPQLTAPPRDPYLFWEWYEIYRVIIKEIDTFNVVLKRNY